MAPGHLKNFSLQKLAASSANGFVAGSTPATSDQARILVGERLETFAYLAGTPARWAVRRAVEGSICIRPLAPAPDWALASKELSCRAME